MSELSDGHRWVEEKTSSKRDEPKPPAPARRRRKIVWIILSSASIVILVIAISAWWRLNRREQTIIVSQAGDSQYTTLTEAIDKARSGARITVKPGRYSGGLVIDKPLEISGDGPVDEIIIEARGSNCIRMETMEKVILRGLALNGIGGSGEAGYYAVDVPQGHLTLEKCDITSSSLTCIAIYNAGTAAQIKQCRIHDATEGGVWIHGGATARLEECSIYNHQKAAVLISDKGNAELQNCDISKGAASGVWVHNGGSAILDNCSISENQEGIAASKEGEVTVRKCDIKGNRQETVLYDDSGKINTDEGVSESTGNPSEQGVEEEASVPGSEGQE